MKKKYIVRLTDEERAHLEEVISKLQGSGQKVKRAWILRCRQMQMVRAGRMNI